MKWDVVERRPNSFLTHCRDKGTPLGGAPQQEVEHVSIALDLRAPPRKVDAVSRRERCEALKIAGEQLPPPPGDLVDTFQLPVEESSDQFPWKVGGAKVYPSVLSTRPSMNWLRLVPFSRMIRARSTRSGVLRVRAPPSPLRMFLVS